MVAKSFNNSQEWVTPFALIAGLKINPSSSTQKNINLRLTKVWRELLWS